MPALRIIIQKALLFFAICFFSFRLAAQPVVSREYQLKAVFIYNFTQFIEWPPGTFSRSDSPLMIGVLGTNPFGNSLQQIVAGEKANGHPITVKYFDNATEASICHILFINMPDDKSRSQSVNNLKGKNILTISDADDFSKIGGIIRFYTSQNKIKLQINLDAAKAADLVISSKLLRLSDVVTANKNE